MEGEARLEEVFEEPNPPRQGAKVEKRSANTVTVEVRRKIRLTNSKEFRGVLLAREEEERGNYLLLQVSVAFYTHPLQGTLGICILPHR